MLTLATVIKLRFFASAQDYDLDQVNLLIVLAMNTIEIEDKFHKKALIFVNVAA